MAILSKPKAPQLEDQIKDLRDQIEKFIDQRVQAIKAGEDGGSPIEGVPDSVLRNILMNRSDGCLCRAFLNIQEQGR